MNYRLLQPEEPLELYARPMARAFVGYPVTERTFGKAPGGQEEWMYRVVLGSATYRRKMNSPLPVAESNGRIVGAANVRLPSSENPPGFDEWFDELLAEAGPEAADFFPRFLAAMKGIRLPEPHAYLITIGVEPEFQGRGVGKGLVELCCRLAQADGAVGIGLDTQKESNVTIYERCGFILREQMSVDDLPIFSMWRNFEDHPPAPIDHANSL